MSNQPSSWSSESDTLTVNIEDSISEADTTSKYTERKTSTQEDKTAFFMDINLDDLYKLSKQKNLQEEAILDSLNVEKTFLKRVIVRQALKLNRASPRDINKALLSNLPLMMFFLLPLFALVLKLFYIRRKKLLIEHLIFMMHFHAFYFFIFSIFTLVLYFSVSIHEQFLVIGFMVLLLYSYKSFRNVYQQNRFKTLLKLFLFGLIYPIILAIGLIITSLWSLLFF